MKTVTLAVSIVSAFFFVTAAQAENTVYDCKFVEYGNDNWVSERAIFVVSQDEKSAWVIDATIKHLHDDYIPVKFQRKSASKYSLTWTLDQVPGANNSTLTGTFKVNLNPQKLSATMTVIVHGYDNDPRGKGKCVIKK